MTEREWLTSEDAARMIRYADYLRSMADEGTRRRHVVESVRLTLFGGPPFGREQRWLTIAAIRGGDYGDGLPPVEERAFDNDLDVVDFYIGLAADAPPHERRLRASVAAIPGLLRCYIGNPFRPVAFSSAWRTPDVARVAGGIDAAFDAAELPVLADALEEAGCDEAALLNHLRGMRAAVPAGCGCDTLMAVGGVTYSARLPVASPVGTPVKEGSTVVGRVAAVSPCRCPLKPGELRWEPDPAPVRCRGDWCLDLVLGSE